MCMRARRIVYDSRVTVRKMRGEHHARRCDCALLCLSSDFDSACSTLPVTLTMVSLMQSMAEDDGASGAPKVGPEYVRFFQSLGIGDRQKGFSLGRLLQDFFTVAAKLDGHLASYGATLHVAVSRMCEGDSPTDAPQHRWIRVLDRLNFFGDEDDHASRVINIGLSYAYRHKEVNVLPDANSLLLRELRPPATGDQEVDTAPADPGLIPDGVVVVARRKRAETGAGDDTGSGAGADGAPGVDGGTAPVADLEVPVGGVTVRGPGTAGGQHSANHVQVVDVANVAVPKLVLEEHPVVTPSAAAVQCVTGVLEGLAERDDLRDFLHQLVNDNLLLHAQFLGGARATFSAGVLSADLELSWPGVQRFMKRWWPVWEVPPDGAATIPPRGTAAAKAHPTRPSPASG